MQNSSLVSFCIWSWVELQFCQNGRVLQKGLSFGFDVSDNLQVPMAAVLAAHHVISLVWKQP